MSGGERGEPAPGTPVEAGGEAADELERLRAELARTDRELVALLARRVDLARRVRPLKAALGQPVLDPSREAAVVRGVCQDARRQGLPEEEVRAIIWRIIGLCRRSQEEA